MTAASTPHDETVEVRLRGFPVALHERAEEHHRELLREFAHIAHSASSGGDRVPERLTALVAHLQAEYAPIAGPARLMIDRARADGTAEVDLVYVVPPELVGGVRRLVTELEEADDFCRRGDLLTLATPADIAQFRRWFLMEFERQIAGGEPIPWTRYGG